MSIPFNVSVMIFMIISGFELVLFALGMTKPELKEKTWFKILFWSGIVLLLITLLLTSIFVVEWS